VTIRIEIDGNEVSLTGSRKGDGVFEALKGTAWKWSRPTGGLRAPAEPAPAHPRAQRRQAKAKLTAAGFEVEVEDTGTVLSVAEEREQSEQRLTERAERYERTGPSGRAPRPRLGGRPSTPSSTPSRSASRTSSAASLRS
jgi:hypothetical protein